MLTVRRATVSDTKIIAEFQISMAWETEVLELHRETVIKGVEAIFADHNRGQYFVVEQHGDIVGSMLTTYEWSDWRNGTVIWIQSVYVLPDFRQKGVFGRMYSFIKEMVKTSPDLMGIRLYVDNTNLAAQKVYEALGMNGEHYRMFEWMKE